MTEENLKKLASISQLKVEPPDEYEFTGLLESARRRLKDSQLKALSDESRFILAYGAAHSLSVAALRWHGYRSDNRYLVFQCLQHTVGLERAKWRVFDTCHKQRNLAEYEGQLEITPQLLAELIELSAELLILVEKLDAVKPV